MPNLKSSPYVCVLRIVFVLAVIVFSASSAPLSAQSEDYDPGYRDTVRIGCPLEMMNVEVGESVSVPIYVYIDEPLHGFAIGFRHDGTGVQFTSWKSSFESLTDWIFPTLLDPANNAILIGGITFNPATPIPAGTHLLGHVTLKLLSPGAGVLVDLDSTFVQPAGKWELSVDKDPSATITTGPVSPEYSDCGDCDVAINTTCNLSLAQCGDFNSSLTVDLTDVVFLINYVFANGPLPQDEARGDVNCSGRANITDAVFMVNYIFDNGPAPCASCN